MKGNAMEGAEVRWKWQEAKGSDRHVQHALQSGGGLRNVEESRRNVGKEF